jgi:hypothetical protein
MLVGVLSGIRRRHLLRLLPVLIAAYELRYLLGSASHAISAARGLISGADLGGPVAVVVLALGAAGLLREMGRGLRSQTPRPRRSSEFWGLWSLCSAALMVCFYCQELGHGPGVAGEHLGLLQIVSGGGWSSLASALFVGFLVAASLRCARWALRAVAVWLRPRLAAASDRSPSLIRPKPPARPRLASVSDGWSSRGPPLCAAVAVSAS